MTLRPKPFLLLCLIVIAVTRSAIILGSNDAGIDITIYREVGQLVVNGINPYDFSSNGGLRSALRADGYGIEPRVIRGLDEYNHYVSGNLPASTALYGLIEWVAHGGSKWWRLALALGDILTAAAAFFLFARAGVLLDTFAKQASFSLAMIYYPSAIQWGVIHAEDKQFQTALMLLLAGLVAKSASKVPVVAAVAIGAVASFGVLFKALGVFLVPSVLSYFRARPRHEFVLALVFAALIAGGFFLYFGMSFIPLMGARAVGGSSALAVSHGSPWTLLPLDAARYARPILCAILLVWVSFAYYREKIDLLNLCAATCVIFTCLWITSGGMDRMNMAMIFAMMSIATVSVEKWRALVTLNFACQIPIYFVVIARLNDPKWLVYPERPDAIATIVFLTSYFAILFLAPAGPVMSPLAHGTDGSEGVRAVTSTISSAGSGADEVDEVRAETLQRSGSVRLPSTFRRFTASAFRVS